MEFGELGLLGIGSHSGQIRSGINDRFWPVLVPGNGGGDQVFGKSWASKRGGTLSLISIKALLGA